ncbi:peptidyl-prolyl cis-trans isomerase C [Haloechinothrix alba]|uniref:Peptidyl-prolyl cis-trans isomerase C n=1 Tax=Haloechinothrix alba TaxID=664784 RepID=A0A238ZFP5_9PSEU|nr:peptidyl-prolyl cis-trans isomerase [Haloechinothrix alba]SNR82326.1 peptidyl-prolyl cis-trans isomerase C [Haloechinothrix alba]
MSDEPETSYDEPENAATEDSDRTEAAVESEAAGGDQQHRGMIHRAIRFVARAGKSVRWPRARGGRAAVAAALVVALLATGGYFWLQSGRAVFGTYAGEGVLSFVPAWLPDDVAFRYGENLVTEEELDEHTDMLRSLYGISAPSDGEERQQFDKDVAKSYAVSLVLQRAAQQREISVPDKQARDTLTRFVSDRLGEGPEAYNQFIQSLSEQGTSEEVVLDELKRRLLIAELSDAVAGDVGKVTDQEVEKAFDERKEELGTPERRAISNIVVGTEDEAERVLEQVRSGTPFAEVAREVSLDGSTRDDGGDLGTVSERQLEESYAQVAFEAEQGELFGPVKNQHGWNVGRVDEIHSPEPAEFDEIKDQLAQQLRTEAALEKWRSWLGERIAEADIVYADEYRPEEPEALPTMPPTSPSISNGEPTQQPGN